MARLGLPRKKILVVSSLWFLSLFFSLGLTLYATHLQSDAETAIAALALQQDGDEAVVAGASYKLLQHLNQRPAKDEVKHFFQDNLSGKLLSLVSWEDTTSDAASSSATDTLDNSADATASDRADASPNDTSAERHRAANTVQKSADDNAQGRVTIEVAGSLMDYFTLINEFQEQYPTVAVKPISVQRKDGVGHVRFQLDL